MIEGLFFGQGTEFATGTRFEPAHTLPRQTKFPPSGRQALRPVSEVEVITQAAECHAALETRLLHSAAACHGR